MIEGNAMLRPKEEATDVHMRIVRANNAGGRRLRARIGPPQMGSPGMGVRNLGGTMVFT